MWNQTQGPHASVVSVKKYSLSETNPSHMMNVSDNSARQHAQDPDGRQKRLCKRANHGNVNSVRVKLLAVRTNTTRASNQPNAQHPNARQES